MTIIFFNLFIFLIFRFFTLKSASLLSLSHSHILVWFPLPFSPIAFQSSSNTLEMGEKTLKTEIPVRFLIAGVQKGEGELNQFLWWGKPVMGIPLLKLYCTIPKFPNLSVASHHQAAGAKSHRQKLRAQTLTTRLLLSWENDPKALSGRDLLWLFGSSPPTSSASEGALPFLLSFVNVRN